MDTIPLPATVAAKALGVRQPSLSVLLNEQTDLSPETALGIENAFGVSSDTLMRRQNRNLFARVRETEVQIKVKRLVFVYKYTFYLVQ